MMMHIRQNNVTTKSLAPKPVNHLTGHTTYLLPTHLTARAAPKPNLYRHWHAHLTSFSETSFELTGLNPSRYAFDLNTSKLDYLPGLVSEFSESKGRWESLDLAAVRLRRPRRGATSLQAIQGTDLPHRPDTRNWVRTKLADLLGTARVVGRPRTRDGLRPKLRLAVLRNKPGLEVPGPERNRSFVSGFAGTKREIPALFLNQYLTRRLNPRTRRRRANKPYHRINRHLDRKTTQPTSVLASSHLRNALYQKGPGSPIRWGQGVWGRAPGWGVSSTADRRVDYRNNPTTGHLTTRSVQADQLVWGPRRVDYGRGSSRRRRFKAIKEAEDAVEDTVSPQLQPLQTQAARTCPVQNAYCEISPSRFSSVLDRFSQLSTITPVSTTRWKAVVYPELRSYKNIPLTLNYGGIFLAHKPVLSRQRRFRFRYRLKKKWFSFLAPNQVKKAIMTQKRRVITSRLALNIRRLYRQKRRFAYTYFNNIYNTSTRVKELNKTFTAQLFETDDLFLAPDSPKTNFRLHLHSRTRDEIVDLKGFHNTVTNLPERYGEVRIPRIKFKPGYQRIWRRVRLALKDSLRLRFIYQQQLTKYLARFYHLAKSRTLSQSELSFGKAVVYSRLLPDMNTLDTFMKAGLVSINGRAASNPSALTTPGDILQITVSTWYYVLYRWLFNWTNLRNRKFRRLVYRKGRAARYKVMKTVKQRSYYTPSWIYNHHFDISDVKPYLEVDYFSLSAVVLYDPYILDHQPQGYYIDYRVPIYRLYNWKYIN